MYYTVRYRCFTQSATITGKRAYDVRCRIVPNEQAERSLHSKQSGSWKTNSVRGMRPRVTGVRCLRDALRREELCKIDSGFEPRTRAACGA